jgi:hypothetical protein
VPSPKDNFCTFSAPFQWLDLSESETLVSQKYQKYQKHQSRNPQIRFEGEKVGFSHIQTHQAARLSQAHLLVSSNFDFEQFHFSAIFLAPSKDVCKH